MPNSTTARWWSGRKLNKVKGTPMSLFRLPCVDKDGAAGSARNTDAIIWVTVVLPLLPVTPMTCKAYWRRHWAAKSPNAARALGTQ